MAGITVGQAQAQLDLWVAANTAVAGGQRYIIKDRELYRTDAAEIRNQIDYWDAMVKRLSRTRSRTRYVVPK